MDTQNIIATLEGQRDCIQKAIAALKSNKQASTAGNGRRGRHMSAAARKRISDAQKKRWAARKKSA